VKSLETNGGRRQVMTKAHIALFLSSELNMI